MYCAPLMHLISTDLAGYLVYGIDPLWQQAPRRAAAAAGRRPTLLPLLPPLDTSIGHAPAVGADRRLDETKGGRRAILGRRL